MTVPIQGTARYNVKNETLFLASIFGRRLCGGERTYSGFSVSYILFCPLALTCYDLEHSCAYREDPNVEKSHAAHCHSVVSERVDQAEA